LFPILSALYLKFKVMSIILLMLKWMLTIIAAAADVMYIIDHLPIIIIVIVAVRGGGAAAAAQIMGRTIIDIEHHDPFHTSLMKTIGVEGNKE
jgi:hypothetical protein